MADLNSLNGVSVLLKSIASSMAAIEKSQKGITSGWSALSAAPGAGGTGAPAAGGVGGTPPGVGMPVASFGGGSTPGGSGGVAAPLFTSKATIGLVGAAAMVSGTAPDSAQVLTNANTFYKIGLGTSGYNSQAFQKQMTDVMAANGGMLSGMDTGTAAMILNQYGIGPNQNLMSQSMGNVAALNSNFNMGVESAANMVGFMNTGTFTANAYRFGMQMTDSKGDPLGMDQKFEKIWNRLYAGGRRPSADDLQSMWRGGGLDQQLTALGLNPEQGQVWLKWAMARTEKGPGTTIASVGGLNKDNKNPLKEAGQYGLGTQESRKMTDAQDSIIAGYKTAASIITELNNIYMQLPGIARDLVNYTKSVKSGMSANYVGENAIGTAGGILGAMGISSLLRGGGGGLGSLAGLAARGGGGLGGLGATLGNGLTAGLAGASTRLSMGSLSSLLSGGVKLGGKAIGGGVLGGLLSAFSGWSDQANGAGAGGFWQALGLGAAGGGAMGAFAGGVGAIPGAIIGGLVGGGGYLFGRGAKRAMQNQSVETGSGANIGGSSPASVPSNTSMGAGSLSSSSTAVSVESTGFNEAAALWQFNARPGTAVAPTTMMGWMQRGGGGSLSSAGGVANTGSGIAVSGSAGNSHTYDQKKHNVTIKRGDWVVLDSRPMDDAEMLLYCQVILDVDSAKGSKIRGEQFSVGFARDNWGGQSQGGRIDDQGGANKTMIPLKGSVAVANSTWPIKGQAGKKVQYRCKIGGSGTIVAKEVQIKAIKLTGGNYSASGGSVSNADGTSYAGGSTGKGTAAEMVNYLRGKGLSAAGAAAVVGNLQIESGLDPTAKGDKVHGRATSYGLAQWHNSRWDNLKKFAGGNIDKWQTQLDFLLKEMSSSNPGLLKNLRSGTSVGSLTTKFMQEFERPADHAAGGKNDRNRRAAASDAFSAAANSRQGPDAVPQRSNGGGGAASGMDGKLEQMVQYFEAASKRGETKWEWNGGNAVAGKCIVNVSTAARHFLGSSAFPRGKNSANGGNDVVANLLERKGALHHDMNPPRGAYLVWNGHSAIADGKGNAVNNWGGPRIETTRLSKMKDGANGYRGWAYFADLKGLSGGSWNVSQDQVANIHAGETILPAGLAEIFRTSMREAIGGGGGAGKKVYVTLNIKNASEAEAVKFARKCKKIWEEDDMITSLGSR